MYCQCLFDNKENYFEIQKRKEAGEGKKRVQTE